MTIQALPDTYTTPGHFHQNDLNEGTAADASFSLVGTLGTEAFTPQTGGAGIPRVCRHPLHRSLRGHEDSTLR